MTNGIVAFLAGIGLGAWVYSKAIRQTGGNAKTSLIAAGAAGFVAFLLMFMVLGLIPGN